MTAPEMTRWQCAFTCGSRRIDWQVMAFGEESARHLADRRCAAMGKGWAVLKVERVADQEAA
jgi:hypothetical protein